MVLIIFLLNQIIICFIFYNTNICIYATSRQAEFTTNLYILVVEYYSILL